MHTKQTRAKVIPLPSHASMGKTTPATGTVLPWNVERALNLAEQSLFPCSHMQERGNQLLLL